MQYKSLKMLCEGNVVHIPAEKCGVSQKLFAKGDLWFGLRSCSGQERELHLDSGATSLSAHLVWPRAHALPRIVYSLKLLTCSKEQF